MGVAFPKQSSFGTLGAGATDADGSPLTTVKGAKVPASVPAICVATNGAGFAYARREGAKSTPMKHGDVLAELHTKAARASVVPVYALAAVAGALGAGFVRAAAGAVVALIAAAAGYFVAVWDRERRTVRLAYDVDDRELLSRAARCAALGDALSQAKSLRLSRSASGAHARKHGDVAASTGPLADVETNLALWSLSAGNQQLAFLPDGVLVRDGRELSAHPYTHVSVAVGGADSGSLTLSSPGGFTAELDTGAPKRAARAQQLVQRLQQGPSAPQSKPTPAPAATPTPAPADSGPVMGASLSMASEHDGASLRASMLPFVPNVTEGSKSQRLSLLASVMTLLKYVAAADRKITPDEIDVISSTLRGLASDPHEAELTMRSFKSTKADEADALVATHALRDYSAEYARRVVETAERVALVDGDMTTKERERIDTLKFWLSG